TAGCISSNTAATTVTVSPSPTLTANSGSICAGNSFTIVPAGAGSYVIAGNNFTVSPSSTTSYSVTGTSTAGCIGTNTAVSTVTVYNLPVLSIAGNTLICNGKSTTLTAS